MTPHDIDAQLLARYGRAAEVLQEWNGHLFSTDAAVDDDLRKWLDGEDEQLQWQNAQSGITPDEYFFITTLYGPMNSKGQRTIVRKFFGPLFVHAAKRDIRNFVPKMPEFVGLRYPFMERRLCKMGEILRSCGTTMEQYVQVLRSLEKEAGPQNPTPALCKIVNDHQATAWKTLSVFVRDCVKGNCFPIDSRVEQRLEYYSLPKDERLLVQICLRLGRNPREDARMFYDALPEGIVDLQDSEPCVFYIKDGQGHRDASRNLVRDQKGLTFEVFDRDTRNWKGIRMTLEQDELYHWRSVDGHVHWCGFLSETDAYIYLFGNYLDSRGHGTQIFVWPTD
jgi:hypothetical protein